MLTFANLRLTFVSSSIEYPLTVLNTALPGLHLPAPLPPRLRLRPRGCRGRLHVRRGRRVRAVRLSAARLRLRPRRRRPGQLLPRGRDVSGEPRDAWHVFGLVLEKVLSEGS